MKKHSSLIAVLGSLGLLDVAYINFALGPAIFGPAAASVPPAAPSADVAAIASHVVAPEGPALTLQALPGSDTDPRTDDDDPPFEDQWVVKFPETGQTTLNASVLQELRQIANRLTSGHELRIRVVGHADERGDHANNWRLGALRAVAIADTLQRAGFRPDQIEVSSQGEDAPVVEGSDSQAWAENRRAEIVIQARRSRKP